MVDKKALFVIYGSCTYKNLVLFLKLFFSHINMPAKFEHHLLSISTVINHTCDIMLSFAIFVMEEICHIWS